MYNPFVRFDPRLVDRFKAIKKRYFVVQTFKRGIDLFVEDSKECLLLSHYEDLGLAKGHLNAISKKDENGVSTDKYVCILDLENPVHYSKLKSMLNPDSKFVLFSSLTVPPQQVRDSLDNLLKENMANYLRTKTTWRIRKDTEINPTLETTFGELFITLKYGRESVRIRLEELENLK